MNSYLDPAPQRPVIVIGSGSHARVLIATLKAIGVEIIGLTDQREDKALHTSGVGFLGNDEAIFSYAPDEVELVNGIGSLPGDSNRHAVAKRMRKRGYRFSIVVHPSVVLVGNCQIEEGAQIMAGVVLQSGVAIGKDTVVNTASTIDHDCVIGDSVWLSPSVTLCGSVNVSTKSYIGAGSTIIQEINVGSNAVIAAGSTIVRDVEQGMTVIQNK